MSDLFHGAGATSLAIGSGIAISSLVGGVVGAVAGPMIGAGILLLFIATRFKH